MAEISEIYAKKKYNSTLISIAFLVFTVFLFVGLFAYNSFLENENENKSKTIQEKEVSIKVLKSNPAIQAADLYDINKTTIKRMDKYSQITSFINHLNGLRAKYGLKVKGFSYNSWKLKSSAYMISSNDKKAYERLAKFIKEYREDEKSLFKLDFISRIDNNIDDKEKIGLNLTLK